MKNFISLLILTTILFLSFEFIISIPLHAQNERNGIKLVVVISVDQMRYEYLTRFEKYFSDSGFTWLRKTGTNFSNAFYDEAMTITGPGHATISTGCYGGKSGIIMNNWYDRSKKKIVNCVEDTTAGFVGTAGATKSGQRSPANLLVTTFGDELKSVNPDSKVFGVSLKDRAAILMAGKKANAAYWFDDRTGSFVTSTYFINAPPLWLQQFNREQRADKFFGKEWTKLLPEKSYSLCDVDDAEYEADENNLGRKFPHIINGGVASPERSYYKALSASPFSAELLFDFAQQLLLGEQLGNRGVTDILNISISNIDFIGHAYGPHSHEIMDALVCLDRQISSFLKFVNVSVGLKDCIIILTADHGTAAIPEYLIKNNKDAGRIFYGKFLTSIEAALLKQFGGLSGKKKWIESAQLPWMYISRDALSEKKITLPEFEPFIKDVITSQQGVAAVYSRQGIEFSKAANPLFASIQKSYNAQRAGDYFLLVKPNYIFADDNEITGTSHGSPYEYDTHVPLIIRAPIIARGNIGGKVGMASLAPTIAKSLGFTLSGSRDGQSLPVRITQIKKKIEKTTKRK